MTVIVGVAAEDTAFVGADTLSGNSGWKNESATPKLHRHSVPGGWRISGGGSHARPTRFPLLIGTTSTWRWSQIARWRLDPPEDGRDDPDEYMAVDFSDHLRELLSDLGYAEKENAKETADARAVIAYRGRIYAVQSDYDVIRPAEGYYAVGAGRYIASGAVYLATAAGWEPKERVLAGLRAAAAHNPFCAPPFQVEEL